MFFSSNLPWNSMEIGSSPPSPVSFQCLTPHWRRKRNLFWQKYNDITNPCKAQCTATCLLQPSLWFQTRVFQSVLSGNSKYTMEIIKLEDSQSQPDFSPLITQQGSALCYTPGAAAHNVLLRLLLCASIPLLWIRDSANIYWAQGTIQVGEHNLLEWKMQCRAVNSYGLQSLILTLQPKEKQGSFSSSISLYTTASC